ncbi:hypothetical protein ACG0Z3_23270, partial [Roseateles sp. LKC17W]
MLPAPTHTAATPHSPAQPPLTRPPGQPQLEAHLAARLWRGSSLDTTATSTLSSGFAALDAELPGSGWPLRAVTELLTPQFGV